MLADHSRDLAVVAAAVDGFSGYQVRGEESDEEETTNIETTHWGRLVVRLAQLAELRCLLHSFVLVLCSRSYILPPVLNYSSFDFLTSSFTIRLIQKNCTNLSHF